MRYPQQIQKFSSILIEGVRETKLAKNKVQFETPNSLTCPDTPRPPNLIQVKTGKELANMRESKTADQTKLKESYHRQSHLAMTLQQAWPVKMKYYPFTWYHVLSKKG